MACSKTFTGIGFECKDAVGGIVEAYIADINDVTTITPTSEVVTAITMAEGKKYHTYKFRKQTGSVNSTINTDAAAGTTWYQNDVVLQFTKMETSKRVEISALATGQVSIIVKDSMGKYWLVGTKDSPAELSAGTVATGTAMGDLNGYNITLSEMGKTLPMEVDEDTIAVIIS